jgi:hypothetical protein
MIGTNAMNATQSESITEMTDADIIQRLEEVEQLAHADGLPVNMPFMWHTILDPQHRAISGDELIVLAAIASLTRQPAIGCRATHRAVATRATAIKAFFRLADQVSFSRIMTVLNATE